MMEADYHEIVAIGDQLGPAMPEQDEWWLREFGRLAAIEDPVQRAAAATYAIQQSADFEAHCSALRDLAVREAMKATAGRAGARNVDLARAMGVTPSLVTTISKKEDVRGSTAIVRAALRRLGRLG